MQVCKHWYDIARPHFFATVPVGYRHREHFSHYVCARPEIARNVKVVRFYDKSWPTDNFGFKRFQSPEVPPGPFDIQLFASTLPLLTNVQELSLAGFENKAYPSSPSQSQAPRGGPVAASSLRRLSLTNCSNTAFIFLEVLSLFPDLDTLEVGLDPEYTLHPTKILFLNRPSTLNLPALASIAIRNLVIRGRAPVRMADCYNFFRRFLAPGCLHALSIESWDELQLPTFCMFLISDAARDLTSISVDTAYNNYATLPVYTSAPTLFQLLGVALAQCTRLQHVLIGFVHKDSPGDDPVCRPETFAHLLGNLPPTLRTFALRIRLLRWRTWLEFHSGAVLGLSTADLLLAPPDRGGGGGRFPELERVERRVIEHKMGARWQPRREGHGSGERDQSPLPRLHAAGLLRF
ncbi:hypothetical protein V8D89_005287, partial [Ganoderma adspersum]